MSASQALAERKAPFQRQLIDWYDVNARVLPWRESPSLYKTVVSEFMLQQTQVKTATPYFYRWLETFPDFATLAQASEDDVLKSWEGLGYYSRARNLLKLAKEIDLLGEIPTTAKEWLQFPGVGPYAAAAICSIAFEDPTACVDGNVVRILARITNDQTRYKNSVDASKAYRDLAQTMINPNRCGDHNQAMMELGATVCSKQKPQCLLCPVNGLCHSRGSGVEESIPYFDKTKTEKVSVDRAWVTSGQSVLLHRKPDSSSRMKGLHEVPSLEQIGLEAPPKTNPVLERKRSITKYRITERFYEIEAADLGDRLPESFLWATSKEIRDLPFSGPHRRWIEELLQA